MTSLSSATRSAPYQSLGSASRSPFRLAGLPITRTSWRRQLTALALLLLLVLALLLATTFAAWPGLRAGDIDYTNGTFGVDRQADYATRIDGRFAPQRALFPAPR